MKKAFGSLVVSTNLFVRTKAHGMWVVSMLPVSVAFPVKRRISSSTRCTVVLLTERVAITISESFAGIENDDGDTTSEIPAEAPLTETVYDWAPECLLKTYSVSREIQ